MNKKKSGRRRFLKESAALAGLAVGAARLGKGQSPGSSCGKSFKELHAYGQRSRFDNSLRYGNNNQYGKEPTPGAYFIGGPRTPLQDSIGFITPAPLHYIVNHSNEPPDIDPAEHRLMIHGMVDRPLTFTMDELQRLPSETRVHFVECRANGGPYLRKIPTASVQITHGLTSCSVWTGVSLSLLLKEAGVKQGASWILAEGADAPKHTKSIPLEKAMDDILVAYGQNGQPVMPDQGFPLRLLVPGWQGISNVKWLRRIKVTDKPYMARAESTQYIEQRPDGKASFFTSEFGTNSVITRPSGGQRLPGRGFYEITGLAWAGNGAIRKVEVSTDGGKTWKDAQLQGAVHSKAHTRFGFGWNWNGEEAVLQSRSTDEQGGVQPTLLEVTKIWNLPANYFQDQPRIIGNLNAIQPWKVMRDGSVQNAIFA